jgi:SAM-dependent methyltransferase
MKRDENPRCEGDGDRVSVHRSAPIEHRLYPECAAGLYSHRDCTVAFYTRIDSLLKAESVLLNVGAGRGANILMDISPYRRAIQTFRGSVARVIGIDLDTAVLENPDLDEIHVVAAGAPWPLENESVDIIVCDHVLEHVEDPRSFVDEVHRVLRPGGWFCARTPTKWGYIGLAARSVPNALHRRVLQVMQPHRKPEDVFPTTYRMNTFGALWRHFPAAKWSHHSYGYNGVPSYHANSQILFRLIEFWCWLMPGFLSAKIHVFIRKST